MKLSQFKTHVPDALIATHPPKHRGDSRLMVLDKKTGKIEHKKFKDILNYFDDGDCMIYFGGFFTSVDSTAHTGIACFNATTRALSNWNPTMTGNGVTTLTRIGNKLVAGGSFSGINGQTRYGICIFDLAT